MKLDLKSPRVASIEIFPKGPVVPLIGMKQQMAVIATFSDGSVRDVSAEAFIESSNTDVATVDSVGLVTARDTGAVLVIADYKNRAADTVSILIIPVPVASVLLAGR